MSEKKKREFRLFGWWVVVIAVAELIRQTVTTGKGGSGSGSGGPYGGDGGGFSAGGGGAEAAEQPAR